MRAIRILISGIFILAFSTTIFSQTDSKYTIDKTDWKTYKEANGVIFSYKVIEYHDNHYDQHKEFFVLRITNTNDVAMHIHARKVLWYDGKCFNCNTESDEYTYDYTIQPGDEVTGVPMGKKGRKLVIFKRFLNKPEIPEVTKFEFENLIVNPI